MSKLSCARTLPWIFKSKNLDVAGRIATPLGGSELIQKLSKKHEANIKATAKALEKARQKAEADDKKAALHPRKKAKLDREGGTAAPMQHADTVSMELETAVLSSSVVGVDPSVESRPKQWLDDVFLMMNQAAAGMLYVEIRPEIKHLLELVASISLEFCFEGTVVVDSTEHKIWSKLRGTLQTFVTRTVELNNKGGFSVVSSDKPSAAATALASMILSTDTKSEPDFSTVVLGPADANGGGSSASLTEHELHFCCNFIKGCIRQPLKLQRALKEIHNNLWEMCSCADGSPTCRLHTGDTLESYIDLVTGAGLGLSFGCLAWLFFVVNPFYSLLACIFRVKPFGRPNPVAFSAELRVGNPKSARRS